MNRKRGAWEAWGEPRMVSQRIRPRGLPGGAFPEGWEFFQPARHAMWFAREEKSSPAGTREWRVCGLLPCKVPLDAEFDEKRRHRREIHSMLNSENSSETEERDLASSESTDSVTVRERRRSSKRRYFASWYAKDIPFILGSEWAETGEVSCDPKSNIVLVINLCATERYYEKNDFLSQNIDYHWLKVEGGGRVPQLSEMQELCQVFDRQFESSAISIRAANEAELQVEIRKRILEMPVIIIHCTHGVNRTGFCAVVLAMLHSNRISVHEAIQIFGAARGHHINRVELCEGLLTIFDKDGADLEAPKRGSGLVFVLDQ